MLENTLQNRRSHRRFAVRRLCKLYDPRTGKLYAGETVDMSETSTLVTFPRRVMLEIGDSVLVALAIMDRQGLIQPKDMIEATVTRRLETGRGDTHVAVRYTATPEMPQVEAGTTMESFYLAAA